MYDIARYYVVIHLKYRIKLTFFLKYTKIDSRKSIIMGKKMLSLKRYTVFVYIHYTVYSIYTTLRKSSSKHSKL